MDIRQIVQELNEELYDDFSEETYLFSYTTIGYIGTISFSGITLWHSEDDEREFFEDVNDYEPMKAFLRRECNMLIDRLYGLKTPENTGWKSIFKEKPLIGANIYYMGNLGAKNAKYKGLNEEGVGVALLNGGKEDLFDEWRVKL
jgi:hypothetical protein